MRFPRVVLIHPRSRAQAQLRHTAKFRAFFDGCADAN